MIKIVKSNYNDEESIAHLVGNIYEEIRDLELYFDEEEIVNIRNNKCVVVYLYEDQLLPTIIEKEEYIYIE